MNIAVLGAGNIGQAVYHIISSLMSSAQPQWRAGFNGISDTDFPRYVSDNQFTQVESVKLFDQIGGDDIEQLDISNKNSLIAALLDNNISHIVNACPFFLNEQIADAAATLGIHYIDFTEDDVMADKVQAIYREYPNLVCAVKCGLAPGFINYIGHSLVKELDTCSSLNIRVGALPRNVRFTDANPSGNYNISWSIDGLVNEYIRPCRVKIDGRVQEIAALTMQETIILDGTTYEARTTSGGIGSLITDLPNVANINYKTLRYPGHYKFVTDIIQRYQSNFNIIKTCFKNAFPFNDDDVIVVYADALGQKDGQYTKKSFSGKYYGGGTLSGIQATTAAGGVAVLEMMLAGHLKGIVTHADVPLGAFRETEAYKYGYGSRTRF